MLDAIKKLGAPRDGKDHPNAEMEALIARARTEREALVAQIAASQAHAANFKRITELLRSVDDKTGATAKRLDALTVRLNDIDERGRVVDAIDGRLTGIIERVTSMTGKVGDVERKAQQLLAPEGDLAQCRTALQSLTTEQAQTRASLASLTTERAALDAEREQLRKAQRELKEAADLSSSLRSDMDQVRGVAAQLQQEYARFRDEARAASDQSAGALTAAAEVERKLGAFGQLQQVASTAEERVTLLNALAEHVTQKVKVLENQKQTVERAIVESNRLNELVWNMEAQMAKLTEGAKHVERAQEMIDRLEKLAGEVAAQAEAAEQTKAAFGEDVTRLERNRTQLADYVRQLEDRLGVNRTELDAYDQRLRLLQSTTADIEKGMEGLGARHRNLVAVSEKIDVLGKQSSELAARVEEIQKRQGAIDAVRARLDELDELGKRTAAQLDALKESRQQLDVLRKEIDEFNKAHAQVAQLRDRLGEDRAALASFFERAEAFRGGLPDQEAKIGALTSRLAFVQEGMQKAAQLVGLADVLDRSMTKIAGHQQLVEKVEARIQGLGSLSEDVDRKIKEQVARLADVEMLKTACDGVAVQAGNVEQKLDAVATIQQKLQPLGAQASNLEAALDTAQRRLKELERDEAQIVEQERRLVALESGSRTAASEAGERLKQLQGLSEELTKAGQLRDQMLEELGRIQAQQREVLSQTEASRDQLKQLDGSFKQLEQRRSELTFVERRFATFEARLAELSQLTQDLDRQMTAIGERSGVVEAVRKEIEAVHEVTARGKADLQHMIDSRAEIGTLRAAVDDLLADSARTQQSLADLGAKKRLVDEVHQKATLVLNLMEDVRLKTALVNDQRTTVDQVASGLARVQSVVLEAQTTLRALQAEREQAERLERAFRQARSNADARHTA